MIVNTLVGLSSTPVDYTGVVDYPDIESFVLNLVNADTMAELAITNNDTEYADNVAILKATVNDFIGIVDDLGNVLPLDGYSKDEIIDFIHDETNTIEILLVIRILNKAIEVITDINNIDTNTDNTYIALTKAINQKVNELAGYPIGQFLNDVSKIEQIIYGEAG